MKVTIIRSRAIDLNVNKLKLSRRKEKKQKNLLRNIVGIRSQLSFSECWRD
jgi:hypothetical protein